MLNAVFLDLLDFDALQMARERSAQSDTAAGLGQQRQVDAMVLRPRGSGKIARRSQPQMPWGFRSFPVVLEAEMSQQRTLSRMVNFEPDYIAQLIDFGEQDTLDRMDEIEPFCEASFGATAPAASSKSRRWVNR